MFIQQTSSKMQAGEQEVALFPRSSRPQRTGVLYVHGAEGPTPGGIAWMGVSTRWNIMREVSEYSPMLCSELGGNFTWGNPTAQARMTAAYNYLQTLPGVAQGKVALLAQSMGATTATAWAAANPGLVARIALLIPVLNLTDLKNNSGYQQDINTAYGGAYSEQVHGSAHNPLTLAQAGKFSSIPIKIWYGASDTLCKPEFVSQFVAASGAKAVALPGGHAEETVGSIDAKQVASFLRTGE